MGGGSKFDAPAEPSTDMFASMGLPTSFVCSGNQDSFSDDVPLEDKGGKKRGGGQGNKRMSFLSFNATCITFLARLHFSAEELLLYRQRQRPRPHTKC